MGWNEQRVSEKECRRGGQLKAAGVRHQVPAITTDYPVHIAIFCLTDDPFDPPGHGPRGGSHKMMFDMGLAFVRLGASVTFVVRLDSPTKPPFQQLGSLCRIHRLHAGPAAPVAYYRCTEFFDQMVAASRDIPGLSPEAVDRVVSYNWLAGEVALRVYDGSSIPHIHYVLALGRKRLAGGESREKVSDAWLECEARIFSRADLLVTCSRVECDEILRDYEDVEPGKVHCIPLGIDLHVFEPRPRTADHLVRRAAARFGEGAGDAV